MRVAIDATPLTLSTGGLARYTRELSTALASTFPGDHVHLVSDQPFAAPANLEIGHGPRNALERRWWLWGLERELDRLQTDVFHGTNFEIPYLSARPTVLSLHDLSPWKDAAWRQPGRVRRRTPLLLRAATMVLTDSQAVRREAIEYFRLPPQRVATAPLAASSHFRPVVPAPGPPYFLYVGTLEPRKNLEGLMEAWREVRRGAAVELVLAGRRRADFPEPAGEPGLRLLGEVPDESLPALYSGCVAFVYPSHYEGFGLPVLEAMQCGACVIVSRDPSLEEVAGDAALRAGTPLELAAAMRAALTGAAAWRCQSLRRAAGFTWERTARLTREVYDEARRRF